MLTFRWRMARTGQPSGEVDGKPGARRRRQRDLTHPVDPYLSRPLAGFPRAGMKLLIVDPDEARRSRIAEGLRASRDFEIRACDDTPGVLAQMSSFQPDI